MGKICEIQVRIEGIYGWGDGYLSSELAHAWDNFWRENEGKLLSRWHVGLEKDHSWGDTPYLWGLYGSLHCHPMELTGVLHTSNCAESEEFQYQRKELLEIAGKLAEYVKEKTGKEITYQLLYNVQDNPFKGWTVDKQEEVA